MLQTICYRLFACVANKFSLRLVNTLNSIIRLYYFTVLKWYIIKRAIYKQGKLQEITLKTQKYDVYVVNK